MREIGEKLQEMYDVLKGALERLMIIISHIEKINNKMEEIDLLLASVVTLRKVSTFYDFTVRVKTEERPLKEINLNKEPYICVPLSREWTFKEVRLECSGQCDIVLDGKGFLYIRNISDLRVEKLINLACNLDEKDFDALIEELKRREIAYADVIETLKKVVALVKMVLPS